MHPAFCILLENSYLFKRNSDNRLLSRYKHVFSWDKEIINHKSVTSFLLGHYLNCYEHPASLGSRSMLVSMFAANKCLHSGVVKPDVDLYNERVKAIDWYERNAPYSLHLYGSKWSHYPAPRLLPSFTVIIQRKVKKIPATSCLERICFV